VNEGEQSIIELCVEYDVEPPAISTRGGRDGLERLSESAGIDLDGDKHGYLAPHGARRGAGEAMVRSTATAQQPASSTTLRRLFASTTPTLRPANSQSSRPPHSRRSTKLIGVSNQQVNPKQILRLLSRILELPTQRLKSNPLTSLLYTDQ